MTTQADAGRSVSGVASVNNGAAVRAVFVFEQQMVSVPSALPRPDPDWTLVDAAGHWHAYSDDADDRYPTLDFQTEMRSCDGCGGLCSGEGYHVSRAFCRICRESIKPGQVFGAHSFTVAGRYEWCVITIGSPRPAVTEMVNEMVTVRFDGADSVTRFGIGHVAAAVTSGSPGDGLLVEQKIHGAGALGHRRSPGPARQCTCPLIDISIPGKPEFVRGMPAGCPVHGPEYDAAVAAAKQRAREK